MKSREVLEEGQAPHAGIGVVIQVADSRRGDVRDLFDGDPCLFRILGPSGRLPGSRPVDRQRDVPEGSEQHRHLRAAVAVMAVADDDPGIRPSDERRREIRVDANGVAPMDRIRRMAIGPVRVADLGIVERLEVTDSWDGLDVERPPIANLRHDLLGPQVERCRLRERDTVGGHRNAEDPEQGRDEPSPHNEPSYECAPYDGSPMVPKVSPEPFWQDGRALTRRRPAYVTLGAGLMAQSRCNSSVQSIPSLGEGRQEGGSPPKEGEVPGHRRWVSLVDFQ